jgi:hypothetical protein
MEMPQNDIDAALQELSMVARGVVAERIAEELSLSEEEALDVFETYAPSCVAQLTQYPLILSIGSGYDGQLLCVSTVTTEGAQSLVHTRYCHKMHDWGEFAVPEVAVLSQLIRAHVALTPSMAETLVARAVLHYGAYQSRPEGVKYDERLPEGILLVGHEWTALALLPYLSSGERERVEALVTEMLVLCEAWV